MVSNLCFQYQILLLCKKENSQISQEAGQEATVRTGHGTTDWFHIGKGVRQGCILSPCLFNLCLQCRRLGFDPSVRKILWRREWRPTPVFLPGEFLGQRSLAGYSPWGHQESDRTEQLTLSLSTY